jgi:hypothetical protein
MGDLIESPARSPILWIQPHAAAELAECEDQVATAGTEENHFSPATNWAGLAHNQHIEREFSVHLTPVSAAAEGRRLHAVLGE